MTLLYQQRLREFRRNPKLKIEAVSSIESKTAAYEGEIGRVGGGNCGESKDQNAEEPMLRFYSVQTIVFPIKSILKLPRFSRC